MPLNISARAVAVSGAALSVLIIFAVFAGHSGRPGPLPHDDVRVIAGAAPARPAMTSPTMYSSSQIRPSAKPQESFSNSPATAVLTRFPAIREANIVCEGECKLVAALGDRTLGPTPFDGNLERFLVDQGYGLKGNLVVEQPGDNDTLLTIPVTIPSGTQ